MASLLMRVETASAVGSTYTATPASTSPKKRSSSSDTDEPSSSSSSTLSNKKVKEGTVVNTTNELNNDGNIISAGNKNEGDGVSASDVVGKNTTFENHNNRQLISMDDITKNDVFVNLDNKWLHDSESSERFNCLIKSKKDVYQSSKRGTKPAIATGIIHEWRSQDPPGRFLKIDGHSYEYYDIGDEEVRKKICRVLGRGSRKKSTQRDSNESNVTVASFSDEEDQNVPQGSAVVNKKRSDEVHDICSIAILSQKQFMSTKISPGPEKVNDKSSPYVEREVSKFLTEEAKKQNVAPRVKVPPQLSAVNTNSDMGEQTQASTVMTLNQAHIDNPQTMASDKTTNNNTHLNDDASKKLAQEKATEKSTNEVDTANLKVKSLLRVSIGEGGGKKAALTPKTKAPLTPKTPKTPAILLSTNQAPNLPEGWVVKLFQRMAGKTAGSTDKYFYSPEKVKFRSMKGCKLFIDILSEPDVDGSERIALNVYKERGYKL